MKRFFIILFLASWSISAFSGSRHINTIALFSYPSATDVFYSGDEVSINIKYALSYTSSVGPNDTLYIQLFSASKSFLVYKLDCAQLDNFPKNTDGTITIKFTIPSTIPAGNVTMYPSSCTTHPSFQIGSKVSTGIINPITEESIKIDYYTIQGLKVEKPIEGLYIWKSETGETGKIFIQ